MIILFTQISIFLVHGIDAAESNILLNVCYDFLVREARQSNLTIPLLILYKP